jgi:hypothetical protein
MTIKDLLERKVLKVQPIKDGHKDFKVGDTCPNCNKGILDSSTAKPSIYQRRYIYFLYCGNCGFKYLKKFGITGGGRIKSAGFTDKEFETFIRKVPR